MTTGSILKVVRNSRLDSLSTVGKITGYSRQHITACEKDIKCFSQYPEIVQYVLTVTRENIDSEEILRGWLEEADKSDRRLRARVKELSNLILKETL